MAPTGLDWTLGQDVVDAGRRGHPKKKGVELGTPGRTRRRWQHGADDSEYDVSFLLPFVS